jgi:PIN domain nuclease of toxin-antitoxin system
LRLLLDTHVLFWWLLAPDNLSVAARQAVEGADEVYVSAATAWEIATKVRLGKWTAASQLIETLPEQLAAERFLPLAITLVHARYAGRMVAEHNDPFDRMIAAQAQLEDLLLVSADQKMARLNVNLIGRNQKGRVSRDTRPLYLQN